MKLLFSQRGLFAVPLVIVAGLWSLLTIQFQSELLPLFPQHLPSVRGLTLFQFGFGTTQELTVVLEGADRQETDRVADALRRLPGVETVTVPGQGGWESMAANVAWMLANLPPDDFAALQVRLHDDAVRAKLGEARDELTGALDPETMAMLQVDPLGLMGWLRERFTVPLPDGENMVGSQAGTVALLVQTREPLVRFRDCEQFVDAARVTISEALGESDARVLMTGRAAFMAENSRQMRRDMFVMLTVALVLVSVAFWLFYRSVAALACVIGVQLLACLVGLTAARVLFGTLNVISIGFGAILLGVGMDYCILVYHFVAQRREETDRGAILPESRWRTLRRAIWLSALTTAAAFGVLGLSSFPGLQQLAALIATGLLATAFFATELLPVILRRVALRVPAWITRASDAAATGLMRRRNLVLWGTTVWLLLVVASWPVWRGHRFYEADLNKLRPANSEAYAGVEALSRAYRMDRTFDLICTGGSLTEVTARMNEVASRLGTKPVPSMPAEDRLASNRSAWRTGSVERLTRLMAAEGFESNWGATTEAVLRQLDAWAAGGQTFSEQRETWANVIRQPDGTVSVLGRFPMREDAAVKSRWNDVATLAGVAPVSWPLMTDDLGRVARDEAGRLSLLVLGAVVALCWWAHRSVKLVVLNVVGLGIAMVGLLALLRVTGQSMTVMSLMSVPLLIGLIIDISLHLVLGLEEHDGDLRGTFRHMAAPVLLTGLCTMIGFGAPMLTAQPALQNFGMVMDMGIVAAVTTGLVILPAMYADVRRRPHYSLLLYRARVFEIAAALAGLCGRRLTRWLGGLAGRFYAITHPRVVATWQRNASLLTREPVAADAGRRALVQYGQALADYFLLGTRPRAEVLGWCTEKRGLEHVRATLAEGKGLVLVTVHLGLFEYGGLMVENLEGSMTVLTLPEPSRELSDWRASYRKRWGADTIEVGAGYFSSVEVVRKLKRGHCVAMLADRPYDQNAVPVEYPGGPVLFSTGPVWLSLLSGSPIVPVSIVTGSDGNYRVEALAPIRPRWLKEGRDMTVEHFTREMGKQFQQAICEHPDQWFQFVPLSR